LQPIPQSKFYDQKEEMMIKRTVTYVLLLMLLLGNCSKKNDSQQFLPSDSTEDTPSQQDIQEPPVEPPPVEPPPVKPTPAKPTPAKQYIYTNSIGMQFINILPGKFYMGTDSYKEPNESPRHEVTISTGFQLGIYEVTLAQYKQFLRRKRQDLFTDAFKRDNKHGNDAAVTHVSWDDTQAFINWLNDKERNAGYHLPSEAEWEYAARAGTDTIYSWGDDASKAGLYAWYKDNTRSEQYSHIIGKKLPNPWKLYDMHGNVREWVHDWYSSYKSEPITDPRLGDSSSYMKVVRGGSFGFSRINLRPVQRHFGSGSARVDDIGFRLAKIPFVIQDSHPAKDTEKKKDYTANIYTNSIGMKFTTIPAGTFYMGAKYPKFDNEYPRHKVTISQDFQLGIYEVTVKQYRIFAEENGKNNLPSYFNKCNAHDDNAAVTCVSWDDTVLFVAWLNDKERSLGGGYRLPSEAEWEYAARAGTDTIFFWGDDRSRAGQYAWYRKNTHIIDEDYPHKVDSKLPNPWKLHGMSGNVSEWVYDAYGQYSGGHVTDPREGLKPHASFGLVRGGSWYSDVFSLRPASRTVQPFYSTTTTGFRLARTLTPTK
jgi:formylglycine-generating enzyme required for sulfatase activity